MKGFKMHTEDRKDKSYDDNHIARLCKFQKEKRYLAMTRTSRTSERGGSLTETHERTNVRTTSNALKTQFKSTSFGSM